MDLNESGETEGVKTYSSRCPAIFISVFIVFYSENDFPFLILI